ncbi:hypothetical protein Q9Q99_05615 [Curtobacterium flaccumfaciens]|nr:hypothetical protein Q9Q99_05615 [Curtobacterium flaccumfaciens]
MLAALVIGAVAFVVVLRLVLLDGVRTSAEAGLEQVSSRVEADGASAVTDYEDVLVQVIGDGGAVLAHGEDADGDALPTADGSRWSHDGERWLVVADDVDLPGGGEGDARLRRLARPGRHRGPHCCRAPRRRGAPARAAAGGGHLGRHRAVAAARGADAHRGRDDPCRPPGRSGRGAGHR